MGQRVSGQGQKKFFLLSGPCKANYRLELGGKEGEAKSRGERRSGIVMERKRIRIGLPEGSSERNEGKTMWVYYIKLG